MNLLVNVRARTQHKNRGWCTTQRRPFFFRFFPFPFFGAGFGAAASLAVRGFARAAASNRDRSASEMSPAPFSERRTD